MKLLLISDEESKYLWDHYQPGMLKDVDLILSCGDLKASYLTFLVTMANRPLFYVPGNHDGSYEQKPPEGCDCIDGKLITYKGLRILGLGGCPIYSGGPHQYTEKQMSLRLTKLALKIKRAGGVDLILTHAPAAGCGDGADYAHRGFEIFLKMLDKYKPKYFVHGHVHMCYGRDIPRTMQYGETTIVNACERYILEIPDELLQKT